MHLEKSVKTLLVNCKFFDLFLKVSKSLTKSKLFIASTLFSSFKTSSMIVDREPLVDPTPTDTLF